MPTNKLSADQRDSLNDIMSFMVDEEPGEMVLGGKAGCVDKDTEYLTPIGWKPISQYTKGEQILQWFPNGTTEFIQPEQFISVPAEHMTRIKTTTIDMVLSDGHRTPHYTSKGNFAVKSAIEVFNKSIANIPRGFTAPPLPGLAISDALLRVLVMQAADGSICKPKKFTVLLNLKKKRKILRAKQLLDAANITYTNPKAPAGYTRFYYTSPSVIATRSLNMLWPCSPEQLQIVAKELPLWDGHTKQRLNVVQTPFTIKESEADIAQYIFAASSGNYTGISKDLREYKNESLCTINKSSRTKSIIEITCNKGPNPLTDFIPEDGMQYCFKTPSSFWLARRKGKIFPTGNTGKTFLTKYIMDEIERDSDMKAHRMLADNFGNINIFLTSSTNKAAAVLQEATGHEVTTIHKLLGLRVQNDYDTGKTKLVLTKKSQIIERALIMIDEASMIDDYLLGIIRERTLKCKVLYIGDPYQLAPVFKTNSPVFSKIEEQTHLTRIQRQATHSSIIQFADGFRQALDTGVFPVIQTHGADVLHLDAQSYQNQVDKHFKPQISPEHSRIVSWSNTRIHQYNAYIRDLNGLPEHWMAGEFALSNSPLHFAGRIVVPTDGIVEITNVHGLDVLEGIQGRYMQLNNNVNIFQANNQIEVTRLLKRLYRQKEYTRYFDLKELFSDLRPLYANTIAKSQGSTYNNVFIDLNDIGRCTKNTDIARMMYTAITRSANKVYMYGNLPNRLY